MASQRTSTRRSKELRTAFYLDGKALADTGDPEANCWLCRLGIDYDAVPNTTPESHNLDHYYPVSTHPELQDDPTNFRHSHALCNTTRGNKTPEGGGLGEPVPSWW